MANTLTIDDVQLGSTTTAVVMKLTLSGSYVQAVRATNTGERLQPLAATNPKFLPKAYCGNKGYQRGYVIQGGAGNGVEILPGADAFNWLLKVTSAANTEVAAGAYNAALTGDLDIIVAFEYRNGN